jgi:hypothetical protein
MTKISDKIERERREEHAYKKMLAYGWKPHQASAIVGNLKAESQFDTSIVGTADDKGSQGVAQWHSGRLTNLKNKYGNAWTNFDNQLEFVDWELRNTHKSAGNALRQTNGVWDAGRVFTNQYEAPKVKWDRDEKRQTYVTDNYRKYSKIPLTDEDRINFIKATTQRVSDNYKSNQQVTTNNTNFVIPPISSNLATVPNAPQVDDEVTQAKAEVTQAQNEEDFIAELLAPQEQQQKPEAQRTELAQVNLVDKYNQIEQFVDSVQQGGQVDMYGNPIIANFKYSNAPRSFYDSRINQINLGEDYKNQNPNMKDEFVAHENRHAWQFANNRTNYNIVHNPKYAFNERLQKKPSIVATDDEYYKYHNRKSIEIDKDLQHLKNKQPELQFVPDDILYDKVVDSWQYDNLNGMEGEAEYYQKNGKSPFQQGGEKNSLWRNIRNNRGSGKKPTKQMLEQERKIKSKAQQGGGIEVKNSKIQGKGIFITDSLHKGDFIGLAHTSGQPSTTLGEYHNHSENPNSMSLKIGENRYLYAIKPMKKGQEITVDYRNQPELEQPDNFKK